MLKIASKSGDNEDPSNTQKFHQYKRSKIDDPKINFIYDVLSIFVVVMVIGCVLFCISGTWPAIVAVKSGSMVPNMNVGDLIFVVEQDRFGPLMDSAGAEAIGVKSFNEYGDVIIYQSNGNKKTTPIIHRALIEINTSTAIAMGFTGDAAHAGYITKGDHNPTIDQRNIFSHHSVIQPVKKQWIIGKALFAIPLIGYLPLHIWEFAISAMILLVIYEWYSRKKKEGGKKLKNSPKQGRRK